jgi:tetratricopeptide (TPR) repeat protein
MATGDAQQRSIWIISPLGDLTFLILTPLLIVPVLAAVVHFWWTPETLFIASFCFASLAHHLPGYLRTLGDRELVARYRLRLWLAPPIALATAWLFLVHWQLHSFELLIGLWATWHILMQTYGLMRIYALRGGLGQPTTARLDWWLCTITFLTGFLFSNARLSGVAESTWLAGLPEWNPEWLAILRWASLGALGLLVSYAVLEAGRRRQLRSLAGPKLLLLLTTGVFYWRIGDSALSILVGVAMFDAFHAIQYFAIVWAFNVRLAKRHEQSFIWLQQLFRERWYLLAAYCLAIAAFGSLGLMFDPQEGHLGTRWGMALFTASAMLHFYSDGFIWRISQPIIRKPLLDESSPLPQAPAIDYSVLSWTISAAIITGAAWWELQRPASNFGDDVHLLQYLERLTPDVPELQVRLSQAALKAGDRPAALQFAERAVERRPRSYAAHLQYGAVLGAMERWNESEAELCQAEALWPNHPMIAEARGELWMRQDRPGLAATYYRQALLGFGPKPEAIAARTALIHALTASGQAPEAVAVAQRGVVLRPACPIAANDLGGALAANADWPAAVIAYQRAIELRPEWAVAHFHLGAALSAQKDWGAAQQALIASLSLNRYQPRVQFALGRVCYELGDATQAAAAFEQATIQDDRFVEAFANWGAAEIELGRLPQARAPLLRALRLQPDHATANYNLGVLYLREGRPALAYQHITRAIAAGQRVAPDVAERLGLPTK